MYNVFSETEHKISKSTLIPKPKITVPNRHIETSSNVGEQSLPTTISEITLLWSTTATTAVVVSEKAPQTRDQGIPAASKQAVSSLRVTRLHDRGYVLAQRSLLSDC